MSDLMMTCGHTAQGTCGGKPGCVICSCTTPAVVMPDLTGRMASCDCGREEPSSRSLAFFEFRGSGSPSDVETCGKCRYKVGAHGPINKYNGREGITDHEFVMHGAWKTDHFYCGCHGWD